MKQIIIQKTAVKTVLHTLLITLCAFFFFCIYLGITGNTNPDYFMMLPFVSAYLHTGITHLAFNILLMLLLLHAKANAHFDYKNIFFISLVIALIYLPVELFSLTPPAIGLSGTVYFLLARYFLSFSNKKRGYLFLLLLLSLEIISMHPDDNTAHFVHFLGAFLGWISMRNDPSTIIS